MQGVKAYNVDDLKAVVAANQARRQRLVLEAEEVLLEELKNFGAVYPSLGHIPLSKGLSKDKSFVKTFCTENPVL